MSNIQFSGLKGKALVIENKDIPSLKEFLDAIPDHYLKCDTKTSLRFLFQSVLIQSIVVLIGLSIPFTLKMIPIWVIYSLISGTTAMGLWVIAHECGHGAFSKNKPLETVTGYLLHSLLLVPYFSWQRSHAVHHRFTNNVTNGETHVPLVVEGNGITEKVGGERELNFSNSIGQKNYGMLQLFLHLVFGWPAYLLSGSTGGIKYGTTNHFWPGKPFSKALWPSVWAKKVWISDIGVALTLLSILFYAFNYGLFVSLLIFLFIVSISFLSMKTIFFGKEQKDIQLKIINNHERAWWTSFFVLFLSQLVDVQYYDGKISIVFWILLAGLTNILKK